MNRSPITLRGAEKLRAELKRLKSEERPAVIRAIAEARQVPLIDYHRELASLPDHGLGGDDLHPSRHPEGACVLSEDGLRYGYNIRNLLTLQALDRIRRAVEEGVSAESRAAPPRGSGAPDDPVVIDRFPFAHAGNTICAS